MQGRAPGDSQVRACRRLVLGAALVLLPLAWLRTFLFPVSDAPRSVDLVLVLGPIYQDTRLLLAQQIVSRYGAEVLMVSVDDPVNCRSMSAPAPAELLCFRPDPFTTRGEARAAGRVVEERGLHSVLVVAPPDQLARAVFRMRRCAPGPVHGVVSPKDTEQVVRMSAYQTAAMAQAYLQPTC